MATAQPSERLEEDTGTEASIVDDETDASRPDTPRLDEYDIISSPNDFNVKTITSFLDQGFFKIPGFQRNYVWDIGRASRLIESLVLGLPIPQLFLYEKRRSEFLVIDGQQRLMSLYYFEKMRFPRKERRPELRTIVDENRGVIPTHILEDDAYFQRFSLYLPSNLPGEKNPLHGLNYATLGARADLFDFRTIRSISIKQLKPEGDASVFEIFNRLNSGGVNLHPQEMRSCLYHSKFFESVHKLNALPEWRALLGIPHPDVKMKDSEVLLRSIAMLVCGEEYKPSMVRFLNQFAKESQDASASEILLRESIVERFLQYAVTLGASAFQWHLGAAGEQQVSRLSVPIFESVFFRCARAAYLARDPSLVVAPDRVVVDGLKKSQDFIKASRSNSADTTNVRVRLGLRAATGA